MSLKSIAFISLVKLRLAVLNSLLSSYNSSFSALSQKYEVHLLFARTGGAKGVSCVGVLVVQVASGKRCSKSVSRECWSPFLSYYGRTRSCVSISERIYSYKTCNNTCNIPKYNDGNSCRRSFERQIINWNYSLQRGR